MAMYSATCFGKVVPYLDQYFSSERTSVHANDLMHNILDGEEDFLHNDTPPGRILQLFVTKSHTDLSILLTESKETYQVHKLIFSMTSSVFATMISGTNDNTLTLDVTPDQFRWILLHAYTGYDEIPPKVSDALQLYEALRKYKLNEMAAKCSVMLNNSLKIDSIDEIYRIAVKFNDRILMNGCNGVIDVCGKDILKRAEQGSFSAELLLRLLEENSLALPEIEIFKSVVLWGKSNIRLLREQAEPMDLKSYLLPFLHEIDFLSMQPEEIIQTVTEESIFTSSEITGILMAIKNVGDVSYLPSQVIDNEDDLFKVHSLYPSYLRKTPKERRLNNPAELLRTCHISMDMKCSLKPKWIPSGTYILMILQVSKEINLLEIQTRGECYLGESYLDLRDCDLGQVFSSSLGPPWQFPFPVNVRPNVSYIVYVHSKGRICKHEFKMFATKYSNIEFCGESFVCSLSLKFCN